MGKEERPKLLEWGANGGAVRAAMKSLFPV